MSMNKTSVLLALLALAGSVTAALPAPSAEAKAKAEQAAARAAWQGKVDAYKLCQAQDRAAANYRSSASAAGKPVPPAVATPPCTDPGPFGQPPSPVKPLEAAGAHSPPATAATPPVTTPLPQAEVAPSAPGTAPATLPPAAAKP